LDLDDIHVEFSPDLVSMVLDPDTGLEARIDNIRRHVATTFGVILPEIRLTDNAALPTGNYVIKVQGVQQARDLLEADNALALVSDDVLDLPAGHDVKEPVYGAPARWISAADQENAIMAGATLVNPAEVLATHLLEILKKNLSRLLGMRSLRRLLDEMTNLSEQARSDANRQIFDELIPDKVPMDVLLATLRLLLEERVSIRNLALILEAIAEARPVHKSPEAICEHVRQRLGFQLIAELRRDDGSLPLIQLSPEWEERFANYQIDSERGGEIALPPDEFNRLANLIAENISKAAEAGTYPALVTSTKRRRYLRTILSAKGLANSVLSYDEIGTEARPALVGMVPA
jgi:flagellar biosynthesis protein FlhA